MEEEIKKLLSKANNGIDSLVEQSPELISNYIKYTVFSIGITGVLLLLLITGAVYLGRSLGKDEKSGSWADDDAWFFGKYLNLPTGLVMWMCTFFLGLFFIIFCFDAADTLIQIHVDERIFLINKFLK